MVMLTLGLCDLGYVGIGCYGSDFDFKKSLSPDIGIIESDIETVIKSHKQIKSLGDFNNFCRLVIRSNQYLCQTSLPIVLSCSIRCSSVYSNGESLLLCTVELDSIAESVVGSVAFL